LTLARDARKLCEWAARQGADLFRYIETFLFSRLEKKQGMRDCVYLILTDPVALSLKKAGLLRKFNGYRLKLVAVEFEGTTGEIRK